MNGLIHKLSDNPPIQCRTLARFTIHIYFVSCCIVLQTIDPKDNLQIIRQGVEEVPQPLTRRRAQSPPMLKFSCDFNSPNRTSPLATYPTLSTLFAGIFIRLGIETLGKENFRVLFC